MSGREQQAGAPLSTSRGAAPRTARDHPRPSLETLLYVLLVAAPVALVAELAHASPVLLFFASAAAIVPLAHTIGRATEELAARTTAGVGGLLNATFGNATELIIAVLALQAGLPEVVKASLTGSILGNLLFVMGLAFLVGGWTREHQSFNRTAASSGSTMLALGATALLVPAAFAATSPGVSSATLQGLSVGVALILLATYVLQLVFSLRTHAHLYQESTTGAEERETWSTRRAVLTLFVATVGVAVLSEWLVEGVKVMTEQLGWSELFVGVVLVAIIGNAAEHLSAVTAARDDRMDLSMAIILGSAQQIALFVAPVVVLAGLVLHQAFDLVFNPFEVVAVGVAVALAHLVAQDGESNWLEGAGVLAAYGVLAVAFFLHP
jgi:Ca2+:H+ antiporter